jgi:GNAT superfamily N-acetyltransferase
MHYRYAQSADAALLASMNKQLIEDEGHRNPMTLPELQRRMAGWLDGEYRAVLFVRNGAPCGYALFRHEPEWIYLRQFFVCRGARRAGVGREAIAWLRDNAWRGVGRVRLDVLSGNAAALAFWRSVGFTDYCVTMEMDGPPLSS